MSAWQHYFTNEVTLTIKWPCTICRSDTKWRTDLMSQVLLLLKLLNSVRLAGLTNNFMDEVIMTVTWTWEQFIGQTFRIWYFEIFAMSVSSTQVKWQSRRHLFYHKTQILFFFSVTLVSKFWQSFSDELAHMQKLIFWKKILENVCSKIFISIALVLLEF